MASQNLEQAVQAKRANYVSPISLQPLVQVVEDSGLTVLSPAEQVPVIPQQHQFATLTAQNIPSTFNGANVDIRIVRGTFVNIKDVALMFKITETSGAFPVQTCSSLFLPAYIEFWGNGGSDKLQTLYPEQMLYHFGNFLSDEQQARLSQSMNLMAPIDGGAYSGEGIIPTSGTVYYTLPLFGNMIQHWGGLYSPGLKDDFIIRVWLRNGIVKAGSGTPGLSQLMLLVEHEDMPGTERSKYQDLYDNQIQEKSFLDTYKLSLNQIWTAGTSTTVQLTSFLGWSPYIYWMLRANPQVITGGAHMQFIPIGSVLNGAISELDNSSGQIMTGQTAYFQDYIMNIDTAKHWPGRLCRYIPIYPLIFGDPMAAEEKGIKKGFVHFTGNEYLRITPGSTTTSETPEVWTLTPLNSGTGANLAATTGNFALSWGGNTTGPLSSISTLANLQLSIQVLFNKIPGWNGQPVTVTVGGNPAQLSNAAGFNITLSNLPANWVSAGTFMNTLTPSYAVSGAFSVAGNTLNNGTIGVAISIACAGIGVPRSGFATQTATIDIFNRQHRHVHIDRGRFKVYQMLNG